MLPPAKEPPGVSAAQDRYDERKSSGGGVTDAAERRRSPPRVRVVCGGLRATLDLARMVMMLPDGREMSGNEFERVAGKASAKKWKARLHMCSKPLADTGFRVCLARNLSCSSL